MVQKNANIWRRTNLGYSTIFQSMQKIGKNIYKYAKVWISTRKVQGIYGKRKILIKSRHCTKKEHKIYQEITRYVLWKYWDSHVKSRQMQDFLERNDVFCEQPLKTPKRWHTFKKWAFSRVIFQKLSNYYVSSNLNFWKNQKYHQNVLF